MAAWSKMMLAVLLAFGVAAAACGGDGDGIEDTAPPAPELIELTAATPFPSGITFYPLYVAEERGYFAEEGLTVTTEPVDGSGATLQQLLAGQADIAIPSPGPFMQAVSEGADIVSVYTMYQSNVFSLQTLADSDAHTLGDLEGQTVGVGSIEGGETPFVRALLAQAAGLQEGDYELLEVGDGGTAAVALERGEIAAYAAAFVDVAIMRLRGVELRDLLPADFPSLFDTLVVVRRELVDQQPEVVEGLGRALARATAWSMQNPPEETIEVTSSFFPEEKEDLEFSVALLEETQRLFELPAEANGQWGIHLTEGVQTYMDFLIAAGELEERVDPGIFVNDFVDAYNAFDPADL